MTDADIGSALRTGKIIVGAMAFGVASFTVVAAGLVTAGVVSPQPRLVPLLPAVLAAATVGGAAACILLRRSVTANAQRAWERGEGRADPRSWLVGTMNTLTLLSGACMEGVGLFGALVFLLTAYYVSLAATALCLLGLLVILPTRARLDAFVAEVTGQIPG